jgi:hypothetical protein
VLLMLLLLGLRVGGARTNRSNAATAFVSLLNSMWIETTYHNTPNVTKPPINLELILRSLSVHGGFDRMFAEPM